MANSFPYQLRVNFISIQYLHNRYMFEYRSDLSLDVLSGYRGSLTTVFNVLEMFDNTFCASG